MKIRFVRPWQLYVPGQVIEPAGTLRELLLFGKNPYCVVHEEQPEPPAEINEPVAAENEPPKRGRKRRKASDVVESL